MRGTEGGAEKQHGVGGDVIVLAQHGTHGHV